MALSLSSVALGCVVLLAGCGRVGERGTATSESGSKLSISQLVASSDGVLEVPFSRVVEEVSGKRILPFEAGNPAHLEVVDTIGSALDGVLDQMNRHGSPAKGHRRINEASRSFENALKASLNALPGFRAEIPPDSQGHRRRSGYPDLRLEHLASGTVVYLDPKLYEKSAETSSLRTFYFTPRSSTNKVREDALHLLLGISHDGNDGNWEFLQWKIVDLSHLTVRLKPEFQASNRDLYTDEMAIRQGGKGGN